MGCFGRSCGVYFFVYHHVCMCVVVVTWESQMSSIRIDLVSEELREVMACVSSSSR